MSDFDRYADKVQLIERLRQSGLENAARAFRDRTRALLRTDRYRKSVSREMSWFLLEAAVEKATGVAASVGHSSVDGLHFAVFGEVKIADALAQLFHGFLKRRGVFGEPFKSRCSRFPLHDCNCFMLGSIDAA